MELGGVLADAKLHGNGLVGEADRDEREDFSLARGKHVGGVVGRWPHQPSENPAFLIEHFRVNDG